MWITLDTNHLLKHPCRPPITCHLNVNFGAILAYMMRQILFSVKMLKSEHSELFYCPNGQITSVPQNQTISQQSLVWLSSSSFRWYINSLHCHLTSFFSSSQEQVAPFRPPDHFRRPVCHCCGAEFLTHCLHPASQRELRPTADLSGTHSQRHLQVHGHLHHGVCGLHDWHVQPVLILPWSQVQSCLHHVSYAWPWECCESGKCDWVIRWWLCQHMYMSSQKGKHGVAIWQPYTFYIRN